MTVGQWLDKKGFVNVEISKEDRGIEKEEIAYASELSSNAFICGDKVVRVFFHTIDAGRFRPALVVDKDANYSLVWSS